MLSQSLDLRCSGDRLMGPIRPEGPGSARKSEVTVQHSQKGGWSSTGAVGRDQT